MPTVYSRICSDHFNTEHKYTSPKGCILLKNTAVPVFKVIIVKTIICDVELGKDNMFWDTFTILDILDTLGYNPTL